MTTDTQPAALDASGAPGALDDFRVADPVEVKALLKALMDRSVIVNLSGSDGSAYSTPLWAIDAAQGRIAFSADMMVPAVHRLVEADEAVAVGYLDQVKLQFDVAGRMLVHGRQHCVLQAALPRELFRFQRRNAFRVRPLLRSTPLARVRHPVSAEMQLALRVLDVSIGGCALFLPDDVPPLSPGMVMNQVQMDLDADTRFHTNLRLQHITGLNPESKGVRLGCEFVNAGNDAQRALQRFIDQTQKNRRLMALD